MAFGLRLRQHKGSASFNARVSKYSVPTTDANAMYVGQVVVKTGTANATPVVTAQNSYDIGRLVECQRINVVDAAIPTGVIVAVELAPYSLTGGAYRPASTAAVLHVCDDPNAEFEVEANGALAVGTVGLNGVLINSYTGSTVTGLSSAQLDTTTTAPSADASNPLLITGLAPTVGNAATDANPVFIVRFNNHTEIPGALGI